MMELSDEMQGWMLAKQNLAYFSKVGGTLFLCVLSFFVVRILFWHLLRTAAEKTETQWDDILIENKVFHPLAYLAPAAVLYYGAELFVPYTAEIRRFIYLFILINLMILLDRLLDSINDIYQTLPLSGTRSIRGYLQPAKLFLYSMGALVGIAVLLDKPLFTLLSSIGALTAILLLLFRDTLLSMLASIRITSNNLFQEGDWIEVPQYGADGEVIHVSLHHVQIQNWDKTIVMIPTYKFIEDSFKNWRGVTQSGGRRIKRALFLDQNSVKFCDQAMLEEFKQIDLLRPYIQAEEERQQALIQDKEAQGDCPINRKRLTNLGVFRSYVRSYLEAHPGIHHGLPLLVRHLAPTSKGIGIEIYTFTNGTAWSNYEHIQAEVFDHLLASLPLFHLRVFQEVSGQDVRAAYLPHEHTQRT